MKNFSFITLLYALARLCLADTSVINVPINMTLVPRGFDKSERIQFAVFGELASSCYRSGPFALKIDPLKKTIRIQQQAYYYTGKLCSQMKLNYSQIINVGELEGGTYRLFDNFNDKLIGEINVDRNVRILPDFLYYAPATKMVINKKGAKSLELKGYFADSCWKFESIHVEYQNESIFITPIVKSREGNETCLTMKTPFSKTVSLNSNLNGLYLIHVRTLNGLGLNKIAHF